MDLVVGPAFTPATCINRRNDRGASSKEASYFLFQGESGPDHDEELCVQGKRVTWVSGDRIEKSYTLGSTVIQACWCKFADFQDFPNRRFLCVLQRDMITVYGPDGDVYTVSLPCKVRAMRPLLEGLLLERLTNASEEVPNQEAPTLFSLMHPLEELKPLSIFVASKQPKGGLMYQLEKAELSDVSSNNVFSFPDTSSKAGEFVCDPAWKVVWTSESLPFIMTYNERECLHTLWVLRQSRHEVAKRLRSGLIAEGANLQNESMQAPLRSSIAISPSAHHSQHSSMSNGMDPIDDGLEHDDEDINTEILVEIAWAEEVAAPCCSSVFLACDLSNRPLLCMFTKSASLLQAFKVHAGGADLRLEPAFKMKAISVLPLHSTWNCSSENSRPYSFDMLVLELSGELALYTANQRVCVISFSLPKNCLSPKVKVIHSGQLPKEGESEACVLLDIRDPVSNRFTVVMGDKKMHRVTLRTSPISSLVKSCLQAFSACLPPMLVHCLRVDLIHCLRQKREASGSSGTASPSSQQLEWTAFRQLMVDLLNQPSEDSDSDADMSDKTKSPDRRHTTSASKRKGSNKKRKTSKTSNKKKRNSMKKGKGGRSPKHAKGRRRGATSTRVRMDCEQEEQGQQIEKSDDGEGDKAWLDLLNSRHHSIHMNDLEFQALGLAELSFSERRQGRSEQRSGSPGYSSTTNRKDFGHELSRVLAALHLVYEDQKLTVVGGQFMEALAGLLCQIAISLKRPDYVDLYLRDFGHLADRVPPNFFEEVSKGQNQSHSVEQPAQIHRWLLECVRGKKDKISSYQILKLFRGNPDAPCQLSRKICHFYDVLTSNKNKVSELDKSQYSLAGGDPISPLVGRQGMDSRLNSPFSSPGSPFSPQSPAFSSPSVLHNCLYGTAAQSHRRTISRTPGSHLRVPKEEFPLFSPASIILEPTIWNASSPAERLVVAMVDEGFGLADIESIPFGVALPLREALRSCRRSPPGNWPKDAYLLIGREDLAKMFLSGPLPSDSASGSSYSKPASHDTTTKREWGQDLDRGVELAIGGDDQDRSGSSSSSAAANVASTEVHARWDDKEGAEEDGTALVARQAKLRFGRDRRLKEVQRLLRSNRRNCISLSKDRLLEHEEGVADVKTELQTKLQSLIQRSLSLPTGRGMYTIASISPVLTEALVIPHLCLEGRVPPKNRNVTLEPGTLPDTVTDWPSFHNGVATGLRVSPGQSQITRTWIVYNRPEQLDHAHAGFLMALGLHGHLSALAPSDFYWYLSQNHEATTVGVLLGMAATKRGTMDTTVSKMLCLHIPALLPPGFGDLEIPSIVQTAALIGIGLLYQGTAHRLMTEVLLSEIGRKPISDKSQNREAYSLAAGLAFGLVTLGRGSDAVGLSDLQIENRLSQYMLGGRDAENSPQKRKKTDSNLGNANKCSTIKEGVMVNVDVTAPGATLALGLMFIQSNNSAVASRLSIPNTHFLLDYVRPDFVLLRVLSRNLIMWDSVVASREWVIELVPKLISDNIEATQPKASSKKADQHDIDYQAIRQAYCNIIAGACLSIGMRYAGSAYASAQQVLKGFVEEFQQLRNRKMEAGVAGRQSQVHKVDTSTLESCLGVISIALALVMAGTGHLGTFRLLRSLRTLNDKQGPGQHISLHMAIGLLFLGGGRYSLRTDPPAIAALVCALFPRFPMSIDDNRYHLQALRHLYVLAAEVRCVQTIDVDTGAACFVPLHILVSEGKDHACTALDLVAPCLLPSFDKIASVEVKSPRFWPLKLDLQINPVHSGMLFNRRVLYVKRKTGYLLYEHDPKGLRSILSRSFPKTAHLGFNNTDVMSEQKKSEFVSSFSADRNILAFADHFCNESSVLGTFCTDVLYECLTREKPEMLRTYLAIYQIIVHLHQQTDLSGIWNLLLVTAYYAERWGTQGNASGTGQRRQADWTAEPLLQQEFISSVNLFVKSFFQQSGMGFDDALLHYATHSLTKLTQTQLFPSVSPTPAKTSPAKQRSLFGSMMETAAQQGPAHLSQSQKGRLYGCYLTFFEIPSPTVLRRGLDAIKVTSKKLQPKKAPAKSSKLLPLAAFIFPDLGCSTLQKILSIYCGESRPNVS